MCSLFYIVIFYLFLMCIVCKHVYIVFIYFNLIIVFLCFQELELEQYSVPSSLVTHVTHHSNNNFSLMPFWDLLCLKPWVFSVLWWLSCCCSLSKLSHRCLSSFNKYFKHPFTWNQQWIFNSVQNWHRKELRKTVFCEIHFDREFTCNKIDN